MLALSGPILEVTGHVPASGNIVLRVSDGLGKLSRVRGREALIVKDGEPPDGYRAYFSFGEAELLTPPVESSALAVLLPASASFLAEGDIVRLDCLRKKFRVLYRRRAN